MSARPEIVLVVDDDGAVRAALKFALEMEGFAVRLYDGAAAVLADQGLPDQGCLIIDYRMPQLDGLELIDRLRDRRIALPIILISGRVNDQLRHRATLLGVSLVLEKPLSDAALVEGIREALRAPPVASA
jgi:FixJ family two-component response regulator